MRGWSLKLLPQYARTCNLFAFKSTDEQPGLLAIAQVTSLFLSGDMRFTESIEQVIAQLEGEAEVLPKGPDAILVHH